MGANRVEADMSEPGTIEKLLPGESVKVEIKGTEDVPRWWEVLLDLITGGAPLTRVVHLGATAHDFVIAATHVFGIPPGVRRIPLEKVKVLSCKATVWGDEIVLNLGERDILRVTLSSGKHDLTMQLIDMLGGISGQVGQH